MMDVLTVIVAQRRINGVRISVITDVQLMNIKIIICLKGEIMENNNELLHEIANELGDETTGVKSDNYWLRRIHDKLRSVVSSLADKVDKVNGASQITDANAGSYTNISNNLSSNSKQSDINSALNSIIGALLEVDLIRPVPALPTASESTMNKLYLIPEENPSNDDKFVIYCTINKGTDETPDYDWQRLDHVKLNLTDYIQKSQTAGLVRNDGTIDTTQYLSEHQDISGKADSSSLSTVATSGSYTDLSNKPSIPSSSSDLSDASDLIKKSNTTGLLKNDGTIDTNTYLTSHQDITGKADRTHKHIADTLNDVSTESITITYDDDSTETLNLLCKNIVTAPTISYYRDGLGITILRIDNLQNTKKYILWHNRSGEIVLENRTYYQEQTGGITHVILYDEWYNVLAEWSS